MGKYFEDFEIGEEAVTAGRTITETDIVNFAGLTGEQAAAGLDRWLARGRMRPEPGGDRCARKWPSVSPRSPRPGGPGDQAVRQSTEGPSARSSGTSRSRRPSQASAETTATPCRPGHVLRALTDGHIPDAGRLP